MGCAVVLSEAISITVLILNSMETKCIFYDISVIRDEPMLPPSIPAVFKGTVGNCMSLSLVHASALWRRRSYAGDEDPTP